MVNSRQCYPKARFQDFSRRQLGQVMAIPEGFETVIESKTFQFQITNWNAIRISEMKFGVLSTIDLELKRVSLLKESITKLYSDTWSSTKLELKDLILLYDSNVYGGFIRIIDIEHSVCLINLRCCILVRICVVLSLYKKLTPLRMPFKLV
ncbi:unnamed protein product [Cuscuta europaea]|uniref:Uncharacterized protein n=1 Tax=Cuscuta europaea TaxID=41803 RepID=A0A9P0ZIX0_CUSEU|nr:unnamed protein product [Cuscuta europaea]